MKTQPDPQLCALGLAPVRTIQSAFRLGVMLLVVPPAALGQANLPLYTDNLVNGFQDWGWNSTLNFGDAATVHAGTKAISVTITNAGGALALEHPATFDSTPYASVTFWIDGGTAGGQQLLLYGTLDHAGQFGYSLPPLLTNTWQQITIPLSTLGAANQPNLTGIVIQDATGSAQPTFFLDEVQFIALKPDSPAWKLGFQKIPVKSIGLYSDELRAQLPRTGPSPNPSSETQLQK